MEFRIQERTVGDVTVLELAGGITLGQGDGVFKRHIQKLLAAGRKKIVLDLTELTYVDSSGLGELVRAHSDISRASGRLIVYHLFVKPEQLLSITRLSTVFARVDSIADIVPVFAQEPLFCQCPRCAGELSLFLRQDYQVCSRCGVEFKVSIPEDVGDSLEISVIRLMAYEDEYVSMWPNMRPVRIEIAGRLDLLASDVVQELTRLVPVVNQRCVLTTAARRTESGWRALTERSRPKLEIVMPGLTDDEFEQLSGGVNFERFERNYIFEPGTLVVPVRRLPEAGTLA